MMLLKNVCVVFIIFIIIILFIRCNDFFFIIISAIITILVKALFRAILIISLICFFRGGRVCSAVHFRLCKDFLVVGLVSIFF